MVDLNTARAGARRKTGVLEFQGSASKGTSEVVLGLGVAARKAGASEPQDGVNLCRGGAAAQQLFGDPEIGDAPIGLGEALRDAQALQEALIDGGRRNRCEGGDRFRRGNGGWTSCVGRSPEGWRGRGRQLALGCREESGAVGCQLRLSMPSQPLLQHSSAGNGAYWQSEGHIAATWRAPILAASCRNNHIFPATKFVNCRRCVSRRR
jgi:hypothetical protein